MNTKNHGIDNVIFFSIIALILMGGIAAFLMSVYKANEASGENISQGWELTIGDDDPYEDVNLEDFKLPRKVHKGEVVTLTKDLSQTVIKSETMRIFARQAAVRVLADDNEVYSYGIDRIEKGKFVGSGYHFIDLPSTTGATRITIHLISSETGGLNTLPTIVVSSYDVAYSTFIGERLFTVYTAVFLFVLGVVLSVISLFYITLDSDYFPIVLIGFSSLLMGLWQLLSVGVLQIFAVDVSVNNTLEYIVMYFIPVPILLQAMIVRGKQHRSELGMKIMAAVCFGFAVLATVLHLLNVIHAVKMNIVFDLLMIVTVIVVVKDDRMEYKEMPVSGRAFRMSIYLLSAFIILDMIRYRLSVHVFPEAHLLQISIMPIGLLIVVSMFLYAYLADLSSKLLREAERDALTKLAYSDRMTGLSNRARSTMIFKELDDGSEPYAIINMDLNGLKKINDTFGHAQGDELICSFASLISELFNDVGECVRMSGDEFIIAIKGHDDIEQAKKLLERLPEEEKKRSEEHSFDIDASYGMAESSENDKSTAEEVYRIADSRMYEMKVRSKKGRE